MWRAMPVRSVLSILISITLWAAGAAAPGQTVPPARPNGSVVAQVPCRFTSFEEQSAFTKRFYSKDEYETAKNSPSIECLRIQYTSDELKVVGFVVKPRNTQGRRLPAIVYNRGGLLDIGRIDTPNILDFYELASNGFVILASQYRGNDGGEGREEFGGVDVNDVTNLLSITASLPYVDPKNLYFYGLSRGGMMTFLALQRGAVVNAAAVVGAIYDLEGALESMKQRAPGIVGAMTKLIPDYSSRGAAALGERSAINWPERVNVPLLMIHGGEDEEVPVSQALAFATKLSQLRKPYELVVYANEIHEATKNRRDRDSRIVAWFRRYIR
jgi:dipeptidyl aminopeptidase/acylaminoacyl peptidase